MALTDLLLCVLTVPLSADDEVENRGRSFGTATYHAHFGWTLSAIAEVIGFYLMAWFAFDRYVATCHPQKYRLCKKPLEFCLRLVGTTVWVIILYIPTMAIGYVEPCPSGWVSVDGYSEVLIQGWYKCYVVIREVFSRVLPGLVITLCNVSLIIRLRKPTAASSACSDPNSKDLRLVVLLGCITVCFYIFNIPFMIKVFGNHHLVEGQVNTDTYSAISNLLKMVGTLCNFALYFIVTPDFRQTMTEMMCACGVKTRDNNTSFDHFFTLRIRTTTTTATTPTDKAIRESLPGPVTSTGQGECNREGVV